MKVFKRVVKNRLHLRESNPHFRIAGLIFVGTLYSYRRESCLGNRIFNALKKSLHFNCVTLRDDCVVDKNA